MSSKTQNFINKIYPHAVEDMKKSKVLASLTIAQAILESGWGESNLAKNYNNLFGIKKGSNWNGKSVKLNNSEWRVYDSWLGSIKDHSDLLQKPRYEKVLKSKDYKSACQEVRLAGYCTESDYSQKLINLIEKYELYKYDTINNIEEEKINSSNIINSNSYKVKILNNDVPVYVDSSITSKIVSYVSQAEVLTIIEEQHDFLKLKSGQGWLLYNHSNMIKLGSDNMAYTYKKNLVSSSKYSIKCPYSLNPQYIVIHDTANSAPAANEISYMIRNDNQVSFHIAVDEKEAIQGLPLDRNAWACGK